MSVRKVKRKKTRNRMQKLRCMCKIIPKRLSLLTSLSKREGLGYKDPLMHADDENK